MSACNLAGRKPNSSTEINKLDYCSSTCARNYLIKFCIYNWIQFFHQVVFALHNLLSCWKMPFGTKKFTVLTDNLTALQVFHLYCGLSSKFWQCLVLVSTAVQAQLCGISEAIPGASQTGTAGSFWVEQLLLCTCGHYGLKQNGEVEALILKNQSINQWLIQKITLKNRIFPVAIPYIWRICFWSVEDEL